MKDYSAMSDFEINKSVYESFGMDLSGVTESNHYMYNLKNYCNSWADAGPIIQDNDISLISRRANGEWKAELFLCRKDIFDTYATCFQKNPIRAAMIVFLMMKDAESNV